MLYYMTTKACFVATRSPDRPSDPPSSGMQRLSRMVSMSPSMLAIHCLAASRVWLWAAINQSAVPCQGRENQIFKAPRHSWLETLQTQNLVMPLLCCGIYNDQFINKARTRLPTYPPFYSVDIRQCFMGPILNMVTQRQVIFFQ